MKFVYPWMLVLVALVPVAGAFWFFLRARAEKRLASFVAPGLRTRLMPSNPRLFSMQAFLLLAGLALILFAVSRPQWGQSKVKVQVRSRNVVLALDVSRSMLTEDIRSKSRLDCAKDDLKDLVGVLDRDRCAFVAFRREGTVLCPLTMDYSYLSNKIERAGVDSANPGETDLGSAIRTALETLKGVKGERKAIVLISDGGDLRDEANFLGAAREAKRQSVPVFTIGRGDDQKESTIPDGDGVLTYQGETVKTRLEPEALKKIAEESGGRYVQLGTASTAENTLGDIYRKYFTPAGEDDLAEGESLRATERFGLFLVPGILLVLVAALFSRGRFAGRRARAVAAAALLAVCIGMRAGAAAADDAAPPEADGHWEVWNKGVDYYREHDYASALATLSSITNSGTYGTRALEVMAAIWHADATNALAAARSDASGDVTSQLGQAVDVAGKSVRAMQRVLYETPDDPRVKRNFARVMATWMELRDELEKRRLKAQMARRDVKALMTQSARDAAALLQEQAGVHTNEADVAIMRSEALAERAEQLMGKLGPLQGKILDVATNATPESALIDPQQAARALAERKAQAEDAVAKLETIKAAAANAADELADLSPRATDSLSKIEGGLYGLWKDQLERKEVFDEAIRAQSNVVARVRPVNNRDWQREAFEFTQRFGDKCKEEWARQYAQTAPASSNAVSHAMQVANEIAGSLQRIEEKQKAQLEKPSAADAKSALDDLCRVRDRLALFDVLQTADPLKLLGADIQMQSNACARAAHADGFARQQDALDYTRAFREHFPAWAQQLCERDLPLASNVPPYSAHVADTIGNAMQNVEQIQQTLLKEPTGENAELALKGLNRVRERCGLLTAEPMQLLDAAILMQSNVCAHVQRTDGFSWQKDALDNTSVFHSRFPKWAMQQCANDTPAASNVPPYSVHVAQEIHGEALKAAERQYALVDKPDEEGAKRVLADLNRVRERCGMLAADPLQLLDAAALMQSNACAHVQRADGFSWQKDALDHTRVFHARFPQWAMQHCANDTPTSSNEPPYTVRVIQEILGGAATTAERQQALVKEPKDVASARVFLDLAHMRGRCGLLVAPPLPLAVADLLLQTNAYINAARTDGFSWQEEALESTRIFRARFPAWAQQYEQQAQSNKKMKPFTKEEQEEVAELAADVEKIQVRCVKDPVRSEQLEAIRKIQRILELLPKDPLSNPKQQPQQQNQKNDKNQDQNQDQKQNQDQNSDQDQNQAKEQDQDKDKDQEQDKDKEQDQDKDKDQDSDKDEDKDADEKDAEEKPGEMDKKESEELLQKCREALKRSKDYEKYEDEKKARKRKARLLSGERDW